MTLDYAARNYAGGAAATTLNGGITNVASSLTLTSGTGYPTANFGLVLDAGTVNEEKVWVGSRSGTSCTSVTRGVDGTSAVAHSSGASVIHKAFAQDLTEANGVASAMTTKGDLLTRNSTSTAAPQPLAVGTNHKFLRARSAATLGLQYDYAPLVFASTAARDTELSSPVNGMLCVVTSGDSSDGLYEYNGTSWRKGPGWNAPWGILSYVSVTANQTGISTEADLTSLTTTFTAVTGRRYRTTGHVTVKQNTSNAATNELYITDGSNVRSNYSSAAIIATGFCKHTVIAIETASAGSVTRKLRLAVEAGTTDLQASATRPAFIMVEDIGPSGVPT